MKACNQSSKKRRGVTPPSNGVAVKRGKKEQGTKTAPIDPDAMALDDVDKQPNKADGGRVTGGPAGPDPLRRFAPPPPPSLPGFGPEVPDHGRRRRAKEILLDLVEGEQLGFCPMCLYSKY